MFNDIWKEFKFGEINNSGAVYWSPYVKLKMIEKHSDAKAGQIAKKANTYQYHELNSLFHIRR